LVAVKVGGGVFSFCWAVLSLVYWGSVLSERAERNGPRPNTADDSPQNWILPASAGLASVAGVATGVMLGNVGVGFVTAICGGGILWFLLTIGNNRVEHIHDVVEYENNEPEPPAAHVHGATLFEEWHKLSEPQQPETERHPVQYPLVDRIFGLFTEICEGLDRDTVDGELMLSPGGYGHFHLMEHIAWDRVVYPAWAIRQRNQATWFTHTEAIIKMTAILERKREHERHEG